MRFVGALEWKRGDLIIKFDEKTQEPTTVVLDQGMIMTAVEEYVTRRDIAMPKDFILQWYTDDHPTLEMIEVNRDTLLFIKRKKK